MFPEVFNNTTFTSDAPETDLDGDSLPDSLPPSGADEPSSPPPPRNQAKKPLQGEGSSTEFSFLDTISIVVTETELETLMATLPSRATIVPQAEQMRALGRKPKVKAAFSALSDVIEYSRNQDVSAINFQLAINDSESKEALLADSMSPHAAVGSTARMRTPAASASSSRTDAEEMGVEAADPEVQQQRGRQSSSPPGTLLGEVCLDQFGVRDGQSEEQVFVRTAIGKLHKWCPMLLRHYLYTDAEDMMRPSFVQCNDVPLINERNRRNVEEMILNLPATPTSHLLAVLQYFHAGAMKKATSIHRGRIAAELYRLRYESFTESHPTTHIQDVLTAASDSNQSSHEQSCC